MTEHAPRQPPEWPGLLLAGVLLAGAMLLVVGVLIALRSDRAAVDVRVIYLPAAEAVLRGESPYPSLDDPSLPAHRAYFYPPQVAYAYAPLTLVPENVAALLAVIAAVGFLLGTLGVLGVRDVRCYAAALLWGPTWQELDMANISAALAFGLALAWRYRSRVGAPGIAIGLAVAAKLFVWPVLVWTLATRRYRTTVLGITIAFGVTVAAWALLGFADLASYPELVRKVDSLYAVDSYSLVGIATSFGLGSQLSHLLALLVGGVILAGSIAFARRGDEQRSFTLAIGAALAMTPFLWLHYLVLLLVPIAVARPRFSALWLLPVLLWPSFHPLGPGGYATVIPGLVAVVAFYYLLSKPTPTGRAASITDRSAQGVEVRQTRVVATR